MKRLTRCSLFFVIFLSVVGTVHAKAPVGGATKIRVENSLAKLPLRFEKNEGQTSDEVKFLSRGSGYSIYFTPTEAVTVLSRAIETLTPKAQSSDPMISMQPAKTETSVVRMEIVGANEKAVIKGEDKLPGTSNYFKGNDQSKWRQGVANYKKVHYEEVYPGIDLVYYGNQKKLEYDFVVKPGADPEKIELNFKGTESFSIDDAGNLILETKIGKVVQHAPVIYQTIDGKKESVEGRYVIKDNHNVAFKLAQYNPDHNLVIDPVLEFSTYLGGTSTIIGGLEMGWAVAADDLGNVYVTGESNSFDFPLLNQIPEITGGRIFVAKINCADETPYLVYSTFIGGGGNQRGYGIDVGPNGNAYVTGFTSTGNITTINEIQGYSGGTDAFILEIEETGGIPSLVFSTYFGGISTDIASDIDVDLLGNIFVTGMTMSPDFNTLHSIKVNSGNQDVFVLKLTETNGMPSLKYSTLFGGSAGEIGFGLAVDSFQNVFVTGHTVSTDFFLKNELWTGSGNGLNDVFVFKLKENNGIPVLVYSTYLGGSGDDMGWGIATDNMGNAFVTGDTASTDFITKNEIQSFSGGYDSFVTKIEDTNGIPSLKFSTYLGGGSDDGSTVIAVDGFGDILVAGSTTSPDFTQKNSIVNYGGDVDLFIMKLRETSEAPVIMYSSFFGGSSHEAPLGVAVDNLDNFYVTGVTGSSDFITKNPVQAQHSFGNDVFILKLSPRPTITIPADVTAEATGPLSSPAIGTATATDDESVEENIIITSDAPAAGFPVGLTVVTWTAEDEAGNQSTDTQNVTVTDTTSPLITLLGANPIDAEIGEPYIDPWATAFDLVDDVVPLAVTSQLGATPGTFEVIYSATDTAGNTAMATRVVIPVDSTPPVITILGDNPINAQAGQPYVDPWANAVDSVEGPVVVSATSQIGATPGTFEVIYSATDAAGNTATATRVVVVVP